MPAEVRERHQILWKSIQTIVSHVWVLGIEPGPWKEQPGAFCHMRRQVKPSREDSDTDLPEEKRPAAMRLSKRQTWFDT